MSISWFVYPQVPGSSDSPGVTAELPRVRGLAGRHDGGVQLQQDDELVPGTLCQFRNCRRQKSFPKGRIHLATTTKLQMQAITRELRGLFQAKTPQQEQQKSHL